MSARALGSTGIGPRAGSHNGARAPAVSQRQRIGYGAVLSCERIGRPAAQDDRAVMSTSAAHGWQVVGAIVMVYVLGCFGAGLLRRRAASLRDGDADRLVKVHAALSEIWRDEPLPRVTLTDAVGSRVVLGRRGHATRLDVSRRAIDARPSALRGELAHEYAHVIDPVVRGDILIERCAAFLLICAAPFLTYRVLGIQPSTLSDYWLGVGIQALVVTLIVLLA